MLYPLITLYYVIVSSSFSLFPKMYIYKMDIRIFLNKNTKDKDNSSERLDIILTNI